MMPSILFSFCCPPARAVPALNAMQLRNIARACCDRSSILDLDCYNSRDTTIISKMPRFWKKQQNKIILKLRSSRVIALVVRGRHIVTLLMKDLKNK
jgi:hypothetical protein